MTSLERDDDTGGDGSDAELEDNEEDDRSDNGNDEADDDHDDVEIGTPDEDLDEVSVPDI